MSAPVACSSALTPPGRPGTNDFAVTIASVNGTGSASVNGLLLRAVFKMGVPVSGKNVFPSNIQGLATWYQVRVNGEGRTARADAPDLLVALNPRTFAEDLGRLRPGGHVLYDATVPLAGALVRSDLDYLGVPVTALLREAVAEVHDHTLLRNVAVFGVLAALLEIDLDLARGLLAERFGRREALRVANERAFDLGYGYASSHLVCPLPFRLEARGRPDGEILIDGNTAVAMGCLWAGATVAAWYPITPSTSVMDQFGKLCERYRTGPGGAPATNGAGQVVRHACIVQAEDELASIGMAVGAGWNGARAFTATSGPGISLMNEMLGLAYYGEIPVVVVDVQRAGPSTGMPTRTQQADLLECAFASHGDTKHLVLFPADPNECFVFSASAFDFAERFQTPVIVCSDLDIGMNDWVVPALSWDDDYRPDRGRVLDRADLERLEQFFRYDAPDDLFVTARTLPGTDERAAYFTRGSGHDRLGRYTESAEAYREVVDRLAAKHAAAAAVLPAPVVERRDGARFGVVALGSSDLATREALDLLEEAGLPLDYLRVRSFPFASSVGEFLETHERCVVVDQNRDGQLRALLTLETGVAPGRLGSVRLYGGLPPTAREVAEGILADLTARGGAR